MIMTKLTEHTVLARTRAQDLRSVRKLNAWGSELTDVSIVKNLPNVEVLSLSVNSIGTLQDFAHCNNLQELYLRKNNITDLSEVRFLQDLPKLRSLWLADNPCADSEHYRLTVIRALPQLQKLDNVTIQPEELENAKLHGNPLDSTNDSIQAHEECAMESVSYSETTRSSESYTSYAFESSVASKVATPQPSPIEPFSPVAFEDIVSPSKPCIEDPYPTVQFQDNEPNYNCSDNQFNISPLPKTSSVSNKQEFHVIETKMTDMESSIERGVDPVTSDRITHNNSHTPHAARSCIRSDRISTSRMLPKGGKNRNANILSAVLCLIKELDWPSLEVVDTAVHCLMEELEAERSE